MAEPGSCVRVEANVLIQTKEIGPDKRAGKRIPVGIESSSQADWIALDVSADRAVIVPKVVVKFVGAASSRRPADSGTKSPPQNRWRTTEPDCYQRERRRHSRSGSLLMFRFSDRESAIAARTGIRLGQTSRMRFWY